MAKAVTDEQLELRKRARRRLIGAIALVTVIAVVLPWVLDSEPPSSAPDVSVQIPSPNAGAFTTPRVGSSEPASAARKASEGKAASPADAKPAAEEKAAPERRPVGDAKRTPSGPETLEAEQQKMLTPPAPRRAAPPEKKTVEKSLLASDPPKAKEPATKPTPDTASASGAGAKGFVVQIGALADADKARAMQAELAAKGIQSYTELVETAKGAVTRVRVGPFATREAAEQARERLKGLGHGGNVVPR